MAGKPARKRQKRKIMIVETDASAGESLKQVLSDLGHMVVCANSSEEALRLLHDTVYIGSSFDALLADYRSEDSSALRIIRDFRNEFEKAPVGLMTSQTDIATVIWARSKGIPLFDKPIREPELIQWLDNAEPLSA